MPALKLRVAKFIGISKIHRVVAISLIGASTAGCPGRMTRHSERASSRVGISARQAARKTTWTWNWARRGHMPAPTAQGRGAETARLARPGGRQRRPEAIGEAGAASTPPKASPRATPPRGWTPAVAGPSTGPRSRVRCPPRNGRDGGPKRQDGFGLTAGRGRRAANDARRRLAPVGDRPRAAAGG